MANTTRTPARRVPGLTRRGLMASAAMLGGSALYRRIQDTLALGPSTVEAADGVGAYTISRPESTLYSVCLQCNL